MISSPPPRDLSWIVFEVLPDSEIDYQIDHPLHHVEGVSHALRARIALADVPGTPRLALPLILSIPVSSFVSGNRNRDANMQETLDAADYPDATVTLDSLRWTHLPPKAGVPAGATVAFAGEASGTLALHGVVHQLTLPITGTLSRTEIVATSQFAFSCSAFGISRPSLFFMPIADRVDMTVRLDLRATR